MNNIFVYIMYYINNTLQVGKIDKVRASFLYLCLMLQDNTTFSKESVSNF